MAIYGYHRTSAKEQRLDRGGSESKSIARMLESIWLISILTQNQERILTVQSTSEFSIFLDRINIFKLTIV